MDERKNRPAQEVQGCPDRSTVNGPFFEPAAVALLRRVLLDPTDPEQIASALAELRRAFPEVSGYLLADLVKSEIRRMTGAALPGSAPAIKKD